MGHNIVYKQKKRKPQLYFMIHDTLTVEIAFSKKWFQFVYCKRCKRSVQRKINLDSRPM